MQWTTKMSSVARCLAASLCVLLNVRSEAAAQTVRGTVTERGSNVPLAGALVTLDREGSSHSLAAPLRRAATNQHGVYAIRAPGAGRFLLTVRRIGARAHSETITLTGAETIEMNVQLDAFTSLPTVAITDSSLCIARNADNVRVAQLWEAARTSLSVLVVSDLDTIIGRRLVRYTRHRSPQDFEILHEELHSYDARDGFGETLFGSKSGEELSKGGYWKVDGLTTEFFAPDAHALLSTAFLRDHCFGVSADDRERPGLVGLTFSPVRGRPVPEISGTLWLDARNHELQLLELDWLGLPPSMRHDRVGAQVHFLRVPNGAVIVKRWSLVMPQSEQGVGRESRSFGNAAALRLAEDGGTIVLYGLERFEQPGIVSGRVVLANGRPMRWARVRLVGLPHEAVVDSAGDFQFGSVPPGPHSIVVEHPDFDAFGVRVAEQEFLLDEAAKRTFMLKAPSEREMIGRLCPGAEPRAATLRVVLVDAVTSRPVSGATLRLHWLEHVLAARGRLTGEQMIDVKREFRTDARGSAQFCGVLPSSALTLSLVPESGNATTIRSLKLNAGQNEVLTLRIPPSK